MDKSKSVCVVTDLMNKFLCCGNCKQYIDLHCKKGIGVGGKGYCDKWKWDRYEIENGERKLKE